MLLCAGPIHAEEGGTAGSNGLVPSLRIEILGEDRAFVAVEDIAPAAATGRVLVAYSQRYWGRDVSSRFGPGARVVPRIRISSSHPLVIQPSRLVPGSWPNRSSTLVLPEQVRGQTFYVQAFVEDREAPSGTGWALSNGVSISIPPSDPDPRVGDVVLTPPWSDAEVGQEIAFVAELRDPQGAWVPVSAASEISFSVEPGQGSLADQRVIAGRLHCRYRVATTVENARIVATENVSGVSHADASWVYGRPGAPADRVGLSASPPSVPADSTTPCRIQSDTIVDVFGNALQDREQFTVATTSGTVLNSDIDPGRPGIQLETEDGRVVFQVASSVPGASVVSVESVRGNAFGATTIQFTELNEITRITVSGLVGLPSPESSLAAVRDPRTGRVYLFGKTIVEIAPDEASSHAVRVLTESLPDDRREVAAFWDAHREVVVILGGTLPDWSRSDAIFEFDPQRPPGSRLLRSAEQLPQARASGAAVWDSTRQRAFIFGGITAGGALSRSILEYDPTRSVGSRFSLLTDVLPRPGQPASVYQPARDRFFVLGDGTRTVWTYDPNGTPGARFEAFASLDHIRLGCSAGVNPTDGKLYITGGWSGSGYPKEVLRLDLDAQPGTVPDLADWVPEGFSHAPMLPDPVHGCVRVYGGRNRAGELDQILEFDGTAFRQLGGLDGSGFNAVYAPGMDRFYSFGHNVCEIDRMARFGKAIRQTSDWFGEERKDRVSVWDPSRAVAYVFGGLSEENFSRTDRIYEFAPARPEGDRLRLLEDRLPHPLSGGAAVFHTGEGVVYLLGGADQSGAPSREIIRFDPGAPEGARVQQIAAVLARSSWAHAATFDPASGTTYIFGDGSDAVQGFRADEGGSITTVDRIPSSRLGVAAAFDPSRGFGLVVGGWDGRPGNITDVIGFFAREASGRVRVLGQLPRGRAFASAVFDPSRGDFLLLGGIGDGTQIRVLKPLPGE